MQTAFLELLLTAVVAFRIIWIWNEQGFSLFGEKEQIAGLDPRKITLISERLAYGEGP
jgi:hypothetical protein